MVLHVDDGPRVVDFWVLDLSLGFLLNWSWAVAVMFPLFMWRSGFITGIMYLKRFAHLFVLVDLLVVPRSSRLGPLFLSPAGRLVAGWSWAGRARLYPL